MLSPLPDKETTADPRTAIFETIRSLLDRKGSVGVELDPSLSLTADLEFDSLELAELSAALEDELGSDPYSEGIVPETISELLGFYDA
jgi:acyl carrier protein